MYYGGWYCRFWTAHHVVLLNCLRDWIEREIASFCNGIIIVFYYFLYVRVSINSAVFFSKLCSRLSVQCLACLQSFSAFSRTSDSSLSDQQLVQLEQLFLKALIFECNGSRFRGTWNQFLDPKIRCAYVLQFFFSVLYNMSFHNSLFLISSLIGTFLIVSFYAFFVSIYKFLFYFIDCNHKDIYIIYTYVSKIYIHIIFYEMNSSNASRWNL